MKKNFSKINRLVVTTVALFVIYSCASGGSTHEAILVLDQTASVEVDRRIVFSEFKNNMVTRDTCCNTNKS